MLKPLALFLAVTSLLVLAFMPARADAKWTRSHVYNCRSFGGAPIDHAWALKNDSTSSSMFVLCDITDDDRFLKEQITTLNIHGRDGSTVDSPSAMVCRSTWWTVGGACGPQTSSPTGDVTNITLKPSLSQWTASTRADFGYIWMRLPARQGSSQSSLNGFFTAN